MEKVTYIGNQKAIERFLLGVYTFYTVTLILIGNMNEWPRIYDAIWLFSLCVTWTVSLSKMNSYEFRMCIFAIFMQVSVVMYALNADGFSTVIPTFMIFVVLLGLSGMASLVSSTLITLTIIFAYHLILAGENVLTHLPILLSQMANVLLLQFAVYTWSKRNSEGSRQLLDTIEELRTVQSSKDDFVANVSHEIRTPINTICGMSELILREKLPDKLKQNVADMQMAGRNLMGVVSDILDFSELQTGKIELEEEAYNITSTINDIINMALAKKEDKRLELIVDCDATMPSVLKGDEKKLRRIIMNLVDNAVKFTDEGCVSLRIGYRREEYGINLIVYLKDTGIGISERNLEKIFSSFSQVDASRKRQEGGLGLGLAISNALIRKMGGAITIKSKLRKGTMVQIVVPQKVVDETPIAVLHDKQTVRVATCIDMEQFDMTAIRDEYTNMIQHMVQQLKGKCHVCRNLSELQRRESAERFTHIFISIMEYKAEREYFDELSKFTKVVVILNELEDRDVINPRILRIYKPFYIMSIVSILNNTYVEERDGYRPITEKFTTKNAHVLAVDDNRMNLRVIEEILNNYNIRVTTAISGLDALQKITSEDYDFVFMDHMMPEMDGVETLHRIRQMFGPYYSRVPIIALTANTVAGAREMLLAEGFDDFMEKPIERSVLERVLRRTLPIDKVFAKEISYEEVPYETEPEEIEIPEIEGLDVKQGIMYCNGEEGFLNILRAYCEDSDDTERLARESYEKKDWTNYTIAVHGLKSAMFSIGANKVSEMAKALEHAGKEGNIAYIEANHSELMDEYKKLFEQLKKSDMLSKHEDDEDIDSMPELDQDYLKQAIDNMEEAMYALDPVIMLEIIEDLETYQYRGNSMKKELMSVRRKIEMSDLISAYDTVVKWAGEQND